MRKLYAFAMIPIFLWSTAFLGVKSGLEYVTPLFFAGSRFMLSGILLLILIHDIRGVIAHTRKHWRIIFQTGLLQTFMFYALYYLGINRVPASIAAIIMGCTPLFSAIAAHFSIRDDSLSIRKVISIIAAVGGVVMISISRNPMTETGLKELTGILLLIIACMIEAFVLVSLKRYSGKYDPMKLNAVQIFSGGLLLLLTSLPVEGTQALASTFTFTFPPVFYLSFLWLSFLSAAAFSIWYYLLQKPEIKVSELNMLKFLNPVLGATLSWLVLANDSPDVFSISGMAIISFSVLLFYKKSSKRSGPGA